MGSVVATFAAGDLGAIEQFWHFHNDFLKLSSTALNAEEFDLGMLGKGTAFPESFWWDAGVGPRVGVGEEIAGKDNHKLW